MFINQNKFEAELLRTIVFFLLSIFGHRSYSLFSAENMHWRDLVSKTNTQNLFSFSFQIWLNHTKLHEHCVYTEWASITIISIEQRKFCVYERASAASENHKKLIRSECTDSPCIQNRVRFMNNQFYQRKKWMHKWNSWDNKAENT